MISMTFTGQTLEEVGQQAITFAMVIAGAQRQTLPAGIDPPPPNAPGPTVEERVAESTGSIEEAKRKRRTKAEMEAARAAAGTAPALAEPTKTGEVVQFLREAKAATVPADPAAALFGGDEEAPKPTFEDLKTALRGVCEADGQGVEAAKALMARFAVAKLSALAEAEWPKFIAEAQAIAGGAA